MRRLTLVLGIILIVLSYMPTASMAMTLPLSIEYMTLPSGLNATKNAHFNLTFNGRDPAARTVFVFLSAECPCSNSYVPELRRLNAKYSKIGVRFFAVHSNPFENDLVVKKYFSKIDLGFSVIDDSDQVFLDLLGAVKTPHAYVVQDQSRRVIYHGGVGSARHADEQMTHFLEHALEQGATPNPYQTKTMGCVIERKKHR